MDLEFLTQPPVLYYLLASILASAATILIYVWFRMGKNRITVETLNPSHEFEVKKVKVHEGNKVKIGGALKPIDPSKVFSKGAKRKLYVDAATDEFIGYTELKEISKLLSSWTMAEIHKFIDKLVAMSIIKQKMIDTTPLIILLIMMAAQLFLLFMIAKRLGVF